MNKCTDSSQYDGGDRVDDGDAKKFVNEEDGLNFYRAALFGDPLDGDFFTFDEEDMMLQLNDVSDLPSSLIVANIPSTVFVNEDSKNEFENLFKQFDSDANFEYFRTFKRCRVNFRTPNAATLARVNCHQKQFQDGFIRCFFAQAADQKSPDDNCDNYLKLPALEKQFLISPPCSPPVGWEQSRESEPVVNFELLSRLASLATDRDEPVHELHTGSEECPKIIIHTCGDEMDDDTSSPPRLMKIPQTRRPDYVSATDDNSKSK